MPLAFVMANTVPDQMESVLKKIEKIKGVQEAYMIYGIYDIAVMVKAGTIEELKETILHMRTVEYVNHTVTLMVRR